MKVLKAWLSFLIISVSSMSLAISETTPVLASDNGVPLTDAIEYVLDSHGTATVSHPPVGSSIPSPSPSPSLLVYVIAADYEFIPSVIKVHQGQPFTIELKNDGKDAHNLEFPKLHLKTSDAAPGGTVKLVVPGLAKGHYPFICSIPGTTKHSMRGVLVVY